MGAWVAMGVLVGVVWVAAVTDCRTGKVYNALTYPAMLVGLGWAALWGFHLNGGPGAAAGFGDSLTGLFSGLVPFAVIFLAFGLGGGDAKLMGAVGAITASWQCVLATTVYSLLIGAGLAIYLMIARGRVRQTLLNIGSSLFMMTARVRPDTPADSPRVPYALAIALGATLAAAEVLLGLHTPWAAF